jgi:putative flippase GtrA
MIGKILSEQTDNTLIQLFRYTFVGGIAFLADIGTLFGLTEFVGLHYLISALFGFIVGWIVNYALSVSWVFSKRKVGNRKMEFGVFGLIGIVGLVFTEILLWVFTDIFMIYYIFSKIITAVLVYLWNFFARKYVLF